MVDVLGSIHEIDSFITQSQHWLSVLPRSHPLHHTCVYSLATARVDRYQLSNQKDDLDKAILHFTEAILLQPWSWPEPESKPNILLIFPGLAIALYGRSNDFNQPEDATYSAKYLRHRRDQPLEIFGPAFPRSLITLPPWECDAEHWGDGSPLSLICASVHSKISMGVPDQPLDQLIECLRVARMHNLYLREVSFALVTCLFIRYSMTFVDDDYEQAAAIIDEILTSPGDKQDDVVTGAQRGQQLAMMLAMTRSRAHETPEYSEEAIYRARSFLDSYSVEEDHDAFRPVVNSILEDIAMQRFRYFGSIGHMEELSGNSQLSQLITTSLENDGYEETIEMGRSALASSAARDPYAFGFFALYGAVLFDAFNRTKKIEYLDESISTRRRVLEDPSPYTRPGWSSGTPLPVRRRRTGELAWSTPACMHLQHATLVTTSDDSRSMPLDYAPYLVDQGQLEEAVKTLEKGRALLWSEMRHLRASIDQLLRADPDLGHNFAAVNRDLEELTKSIPPSFDSNLDKGGTDDLRAVDPFGRLLLKQRRLLKERNMLISKIQALPGFDSFVKPLSFDTLRTAASSGPVVIINHTIWRSDILILPHNTSPSLIPTSRDFYDRATALRDKLLDSRSRYGLDSDHYDQTLAFVLAELYELVGKPVIDRFHQLNVPEQSRIWWCPTSVFCSLPLHAMGPIPSDDGEMRYFLDLYICSYTPTLSALIQSRNRDSGSRSSDRPSLLLVAQPQPSLPTVGGEIQVVQSLDTKVTSLISEAATPAAVVDGFHRHQFVHFACHGTLEAGKPFEAGFELHGGERLTLLEIVSSELPTAEFAFLSACHTAEVTEGSIVDEGLHLVAAVQYCGFRSVVGTMWAMADVDGWDLAKHFYKALFSTSEGEQGVWYHERSAKALRFAVKKLRRKKRMTLERWVNFVHYGA
ncbi:CHAT domain-containing protein [Lactarius deliciosus]|nr:CHAT domain-containing protein [Lactarius deliciosus]